MSEETIFCKYHGELVPSILSDNLSVTFHSEFNSGGNLKVGDNLIYISYPYFQLPPFGMVLDTKDMDIIKPLLKSANLSIVQKTLLIGNYKISLEKSQPVKTKIDNKNLSLNVQTSLLKNYLTDIYNEYVYRDDLSEMINYLIGRGQGLTPSGDDFIVGLLALNSRLDFLSQEVLITVNNSIYDKRTTDVSIAYLKSALRNQYSTSLVKVIESLEDNVALKRYLEELSHTGHSSGKDTISGIYFGLEKLVNGRELWDKK